MTLAIRLEPKLEKRLAALAQATGRTKSYYVREALERTLEDIEDLYYALYRSENPGRRWSMEEVKHEIGMGNRVGKRSGKRTKKA